MNTMAPAKGCPFHDAAADFDPFDLTDPFPFYEFARAEAPVFYSEKLGYWVVARYADIKAVFENWQTFRGVDKTWGSCGAFSVCDGQPTIENCGPCDGYSVSPFGRPPHPSALSHAGIGNVID